MAKPIGDELEQLVAQAQRIEPPVLSEWDARSLVRRALIKGQERAASGRRRARYAWLAAAAALLLGVVRYGVLQPEPGTEIAVAADGLPLRLSLKTGDTLVLAPAARLEVLSEQPALRRLRLERGDALFDVVRGAADQRFEVLTPHARVRVHGTVFSVRVEARRSIVRVHEGSVVIEHALLGAGSVWTSDRKPLAAEEKEEKLWAADVRAALDARAVTTLRAEPETRTDEPVWEAARPSEPAPLPPSSEVDAATRVKPKPPSAAHAPREQEAYDEPAAPDIHQLRELLRLGQAHQVVYYARPRSEAEDAFALILADGLRALGRFEEACSQYEQLAARAPEPLQTQAAFAAAQLALITLNDPPRALRGIEFYRLSRAGSPLAERGSTLHVQALVRLGRAEEARRVAVRYFAREPETEAKQRMRELLREAGAPDPLSQWEEGWDAQRPAPP